MPISRAEARSRGLKKYFSGKPCPSGHITHRYVAGGGCAGCYAVRAKQKYDGGWRQDTTNRKQVNARWNASTNGLASKQRWRERNPKRAWCVHIRTGMRTRAANKGVPFDASVDYLVSITPDVCPVFGTPFNFINNGKMAHDSPSADRLHPNLGYVEGNIRIISVKANTIKSAYTADDVARVAGWMRAEGL